MKASWPHDEAEDEGTALATWAGDGAVRLLAEDGCVLLLERLDADRSLEDEPIDAAVQTAATLLRRLAIPAPPLVRSTRDVAALWAETLPSRAAATPIPRRLVDAAVAVCRDLGPTSGSLLVDEDLHYGNVLRADREPWLVIDPKPITGDAEYGVVPMLWNRYEETGGAQGFHPRLDKIVEVAGLDRDRTRGWTLLRAVTNWLWTLDGGGYWETAVAAQIAEVAAEG